MSLPPGCVLDQKLLWQELDHHWALVQDRLETAGFCRNPWVDATTCASSSSSLLVCLTGGVMIGAWYCRLSACRIASHVFRLPGGPRVCPDTLRTKGFTLRYLAGETRFNPRNFFGKKWNLLTLDLHGPGVVLFLGRAAQLIHKKMDSICQELCLPLIGRIYHYVLESPRKTSEHNFKFL